MSLLYISKPLLPEPNKNELVPRLARNLYLARALKFGKFLLTSGLNSPYYINERKLPASRPQFTDVPAGQLVRDVASAFYWMLKNEIGLDNFDIVLGIPEAIIPFSGALTALYGIPAGYTVKVAKDHGIQDFVQADLTNGDRIIPCDDLATTGGSITDAVKGRIEKQAEQDHIYVRVDDAMVLVDRLQGAKSNLSDYKSRYSPNGIRLHSFMTILEMVDILKDDHLMTKEEYHLTTEYVRLSQQELYNEIQKLFP